MPSTERSRGSEARSDRLLEVARDLVSELELELVLDRVVDAARDLTGARYAALGILDERKDELERFIYRGIDEETRRQIGPVPRGHGLLGELIRRPRPLRIADISSHPHSYGFPPEHPSMTTFLGAPILIAGEAWGNLYLTDKAGGREFDQEDEDLVVLLAQWAAVAIENARLHETLVRRGAELERAVRGLEANASIARAVAGETEPERVLELVAKRGRAVLDSRAMLVLLAEGDRLAVAACAGEGDDPRGASVPVDGSLPGEVLRSQRPMRLGPEATARIDSLHGLGELRTALVVPMVFRGQARGVLVALGRTEDGDPFDADDEIVAESFAAAAGAGIFTAHTVETEKLQRSIEAAEQERRRWARELHDETLQELAGLNMTLETAVRQPGEEALRSAVSRALDHAQRSIDGVHAMINELRPPALDQLGLKAALETLVDRSAAAHDVVFDAALEIDLGDGAARLPTEVETVVYRLVQEALNNAIKHSEADRVEIRVAAGRGGLLARVSDDGDGFDPSAEHAGFGLIGMRERAALVGGALRIESEPGSGTTVSAELPLPA